MSDIATEFWEQYQAATDPMAKDMIVGVMVAHIRKLEKLVSLDEESLKVEEDWAKNQDPTGRYHVLPCEFDEGCG